MYLKNLIEHKHGILFDFFWKFLERKKVKLLSNVDSSKVEIVSNNLYERLPGLINFVKFVKKSISFFKEI